MDGVQKITLEIPEDLLRRARAATGEGITATVRRGLELLARQHAYDALRNLRGRVAFTLDVAALREDRD